ncbi:MAG: hypothetical protein GX817_05010 [Elusimicrobia bacterium]|nr:hypothetical protein [Elusimicrobiota bacterium]
MGAYIFSCEVLSSQETDLGWRSALEYDLEVLIPRGGFSYLNETDYALGFGIPYGRWSFDYSFSPHRDFSPVHRMSVSSHF